MGDHLLDTAALQEADQRVYHGNIPTSIAIEEFIKLSKKSQRRLIALHQQALGLPASKRRVRSIETWDKQHKWINNAHSKLHREWNRNKHFRPVGDQSLHRVKEKMDTFAQRGYPF